MRISTVGARALSGSISIALLAGCSGLGRQSSSVPVASLQSVARQQSAISAVPRELIGIHPPAALLIGNGMRANAVTPAAVYVGEFSASFIGDYKVPNPKNKAVDCSVTGISAANGIGVSPTHILYDPDGGTRTLITFGPHCGQMLNSVPIPTGTQPTDVAFDNASQTAYIDTIANDVYPIKFGATTFGTPLTCTAYAGESFGIATDKQGDVFVNGRTSSGTSVVVEFVKGKGACKTLGVTGFGTVVGLIVDTKGNLIDVDISAGILIWAPPYKGAPTRVIAEQGESVYGKLDEAGDTLYVSDYTNGSVDVYRYKPGTYAYSWNNGLTQSDIVEGIGTDPPQP